MLSDAISALVLSTSCTRDHHKHNTFSLLVFGKLDFALHHDLILKNDDIAGEIHLLLQDSAFFFFLYPEKQLHYIFKGIKFHIDWFPS